MVKPKFLNRPNLLVAGYLATIIAGASLLSAQPTSSLQFGVTTEILNTTSTGAVNGAAFSLPTQTANVLTWQLNPVGGPSAINVTFQVSLDGSNWININVMTGTTASSALTGVNSYRFVRAIQTSRTGGTSTQVLLSVGRAYQMNSSASAAPTVNGTMTFNPDTTYDIGLSGDLRPRRIYMGNNGQIHMGGSGGSRGFMTGTADGVFQFTNAAGNDYNRLMLGGSTASFPALKRVGTAIQVRLADDSANTQIGIMSIAYASTLFSGLGTPSNGTVLYCSDCVIGAVCAGSGTGAIAQRLNGVWVCN